MITRLIAIALSVLMTTSAAADETALNQTVLKVPITQKSMEEAAEYLKQRAKALGIQQIAYNPLYKEFKAQGLTNIRRTEIFQFCDTKIAKALIEHDISFAAYLPCRVGLIEDQHNQGWFVMINPMIFKASIATMPPKLKKQADKVCSTLMTVIGVSPPPANQPFLSLEQTIFKKQIIEEAEMNDAIESMLMRANDLNVKNVARINLTDKYKALGLPNIRHTEIFQFCDAPTSKKLLDHDVRYIAYMPCRIALVEDHEGNGWLVMMKLDNLMPSHLHGQPIELYDKLKNILEAGANWDF